MHFANDAIWGILKRWGDRAISIGAPPNGWDENKKVGYQVYRYVGTYSNRRG